MPRSWTSNSANFDTGTLTVSFAAGSDSAEDVLAIRNEGSGAGQISVSGGNVSYGGTLIGTFTGGSGGANLIVTFNSNTTPAAAQALLRNVTYHNTDTTAPTTGARTVRFVLTDGDGGTSVNHDAFVVVGGGLAIWTNNTNNPQHAQWDGSAFGAATAPNALGEWTHIQAAEAPTRTEIIAVGVDSAGVMRGEVWNGSTWTAFSFNTIVDLGTTGYQSFQIAYEQQSGDAVLVWDNGTTGSASLSYRTWNGTSWSAAQTITTPVSGEAVQLRLAADPNSDSMILAVTGTPVANDYALVWNGSGWGNSVTLDTGTGIDGTEIHVAYEAHSGQALVVYDADGTTNAINYRTWDGTSWSAQQSLSAPAGVAAGSDASFGLLVSDPNSNRIALGVVGEPEIWLAVWDGNAWTSTLTATASAGSSANLNVALGFEHDSGDLLAAYGKNGSNFVAYRTWTSAGGWSAETASNANLNLGATPEALALFADPNSNQLMLGTRDSGSDVRYALWTGSAWGPALADSTGDAGGAYATPMAFVWYGNNRTPVISTTALSMAENSTLAGSVASSDADGDTRSYSIVGGADQAKFTIDSGTGALSFISAPDYESPTDAGANNVYDVIVQVADGKGGTDSESIAVTVTNVNDAPIATNLSAAETYTEDTALNLIDIVISDVDSANVTATLTLSNTAAGSLNTGTSGAVTSTYNAGTGVWTASGAIANVNALLAGLNFTPAANFNSNFTISTSVSDGVAAPVTGSKAMTGTAVNDAPSATNLSAAEAYTEDAALNLTDIVISDVDSASVTATLTLSNTAAGSLNTGTSGAVTSTYNAGTGVWTASGAIANVNALLAGLTFTPAANFNSNFTIATSVSDGVAAPVTGSKAMTGTAVNDAPSASNLSAGETYTEDTALNLTDIVISDVDSANVTATLTLSNTAAGSLNTGTSGVVTSTYNAGTGVWTASGAVADVNTLLATLTFTPAANFNSNFTIATSVSDGVAAPVTGSKAMTGTAVNDAPVITSNGGGASASVSVAENSTAVTTVTSSDVDGGAPTYSILAGGDGAKFSDQCQHRRAHFRHGTGLREPDRRGRRQRLQPDRAGERRQRRHRHAGDHRHRDQRAPTASGSRRSPSCRSAARPASTRHTGDIQSINANVRPGHGDRRQRQLRRRVGEQPAGRRRATASMRSASAPTARAQGAEFRVNTTTADNQINPAVAMDAAGNFVVTWSSNLQDGSGYGIYAQRYNAAGVAQGAEFLVNTTTAGSQIGAGDRDGAERRLRHRLDQRRPGPGCQLRHLRAALQRQRRGAGRRVPRQHLHDQYAAADVGRDGRRRATSSSPGPANRTGRLRLRRLRPALRCQRRGAGRRVPRQHDDRQQPALSRRRDARRTAGLSWSSRAATPTAHSRSTCSATRRTARRSVARRASTRAPSRRHSNRSRRSAPMPSGNITVVWNSSADGSGVGVVGRRFDWSGTALGGEFQVNTTTAGDQLYPEVVAQPGGGFIVAWGGNGSATPMACSCSATGCDDRGGWHRHVQRGAGSGADRQRRHSDQRAGRHRRQRRGRLVDLHDRQLEHRADRHRDRRAGLRQ